MRKKEVQRFMLLTLVFLFSCTPVAFGMHIMEGFLSPVWCISWGVLSLPFVVLGFRKIGSIVKADSQLMIMIAMTGAFAFILSSLKIPSVTGSSSHMTGVGFGAIMFGPVVTSVLGFIVLLFQALLLAHGGLTTLGANTFSMGIAGPIATFGIYKLCMKLNVNKKVAIFLAAMLGDLATYMVTSLQLALAFPSEAGGVTASLTKFLGVFALTQLPLAIAEGILTVIIIDIVSVYGKELFDKLHKGGFLKYES